VFLPSLLVFVALDAVWITLVASGLYAPLKPILKADVDLLAAAASWLCIVLGNYCFVLPRTGGGATPWCTVGQGALFGALLYGTVDLTNAALLAFWSWKIALVDIAWGTAASALLALTQRTLASAFPSLGLM
jgi:uncharacterized membrane protein